MPLADLDANASGRNSRASNMSAASRPPSKGPGPGFGPPAAKQPESMPASVTSMTRMSIESNLGGLAGDTGFSNMPRPPRQGGTTSRQSVGSSRSNRSSRTSGPRRRLPSSSSGPRHPRDHQAQYTPQYVADSLEETAVHIPGTSPLGPFAHDTHGYRTQSMTMANTSGPAAHKLTSRSCASLQPVRNKPHPQFPPGQKVKRSISPARPKMSRHGHGGGGPGPASHQGQRRIGYPSEPSIRRNDRAYMVDRPPSQPEAEVYYGYPGPGIPPLPKIPDKYLEHPAPGVPLVNGIPDGYRGAVVPARKSQKSAKTSISSRSTNRRTDSDGPSSDAPSPPTPRDGASMEVLVPPTGTVVIGNMAGFSKAETMSGPLYYDYSEQFATDTVEANASGLPTGFVHSFKTILEEQAATDPLSNKCDPSIAEKAIEQPVAGVPEIAELPASPVPRRITRNMILAALEPVSTTGDVESSEGRVGSKGDGESLGQDKEEQNISDAANSDQAVPSLPTQEEVRNRHSILSQVGSSVIDSSTLNFAVQYSIPMATGNGIDAEDETGPTPTAAPRATTEDDMTDLLDGYQHTETKQTNEAILEEGDLVDERADKKSKHTPKTSDEQSFKSCTDLPDMTDHPIEEPDAGSLQSSELPDPDPRFKDSDARSFKTCKDAVTPDRPVSLPPVRLPSSSLGNSDLKVKRPFSEISRLSPSPTVRRVPPVATSEPSLPKGVGRLQNISKPNSKTGSTAVSIFSSTESSILKPPRVPPRESSSSKEAERSHAVAGFLVRTGRRFSRAQPHFARKEGKDGGSASRDGGENPEDIPTPPPLRERPLSRNGVGLEDQAPGVVKATEKAFAKREVVPGTRTATVATAYDKLIPQERIVAKTCEMKAAPIVHQYSLSSPSPIISESSSVYSPENISFSKSRIQSSPAPYPNSPGHNRRDSQSTTHLSWNGPKSLNMSSGDGGDGRVGQANGREETTTDLRFSAYKYPMNHLPDLKEESHEDSSLNTSASNLKNSSFRFPPSGQPGARASVEEGVMFGHNIAVNSNQGSSLAQTRGLPSMNFSHMNLIEKLHEALDMDSASLLEGVPDEAEDLSSPGPLRPSSPGDIREKVRSFVAGLNELEQTGGATQPRLANLMQNKGLFSREALVAEIEKLDIPSVEALTQRLSELLPSLREYYERGEEGEFLEEEVIMEHALEEINEVGGPAPKRSSARLRPMPGSPDMLVVEDILYEELTNKEKGDASSPDDGGERLSEKRHGENGAAKGRSWSVAHPRTRDQTASVDFETPSPAALRTRSLSLGDSELHRSQDISFVSRKSVRSPLSTPTATETRPWNSDKNYPWATTAPFVDIALTSPSAVKASPHPGPSHLRNRVSDSSFSTTGTLNQSGTFSSPSAQSGAMAMPGSDDPYTHARRPSGNQIHWSEYSALASSASPGQGISHLQTPGERYPTSALSLPMDLHFVDDLTSGFYEDVQDPTPAESNTRKVFNFVKRIGGRKKAPSHEDSTVDTRGADIQASASERQIADGAGNARAKPNRETYTNAQGMPAGTYHRERIFDKIKKWFCKGSKLIQGLRRQKPAVPRNNDAIATTAPPVPPVQPTIPPPPPPVHQSDDRPRDQSPPLLIFRTDYRSRNRSRRDDPRTLSVVSE